jgi:hypothetical protein
MRMALLADVLDTVSETFCYSAIFTWHIAQEDLTALIHFKCCIKASPFKLTA